MEEALNSAGEELAEMSPAIMQEVERAWKVRMKDAQQRLRDLREEAGNARKNWKNARKRSRKRCVMKPGNGQRNRRISEKSSKSGGKSSANVSGSCVTS